jgi:5-methylcytosine-specific restriction enzyme A
MSRPARKAIPERIKLEVFARQNGRCALTGRRLASIWSAEFDHVPPLGLRPVAPSGADYEPAQLDPAYIQALSPEAHRAKTCDDQGWIAKTKRIADKHAGIEKPRKSRWPKRPFSKRKT